VLESFLDIILNLGNFLLVEVFEYEEPFLLGDLPVRTDSARSVSRQRIFKLTLPC
jgi:hypothetical protein